MCAKIITGNLARRVPKKKAWMQKTLKLPEHKQDKTEIPYFIYC